MDKMIVLPFVTTFGGTFSGDEAAEATVFDGEAFLPV
jgi:hypothetical protein